MADATLANNSSVVIVLIRINNNSNDNGNVKYYSNPILTLLFLV